MKIGIELECFLPYGACRHIEQIRRSYHSNIPDNKSGWRFEVDGSLNAGNAHAFTVEMISPILSTLAEVKSSLNTLLYSRIGFNRNTPVLNGHTLNKSNDWVTDYDAESSMQEIERKSSGYLGLNTTCGCHIHFSKKGNDTPSWPVELCEKMAEDYASWLQFAYPAAYPYYAKQYNRDYAQKIGVYKEEVFSARRREFHYTSNRQGIEWRAFNLAGAKTIGEIIDRIVQAYTLIEKWSRINYKVSTRYTHKYKEEDKIDTVALSAYFQEFKNNYIMTIEGIGYELDKYSETKITMKKKKTTIQLGTKVEQHTTTEVELAVLPLTTVYEFNRTYKCVI